MPLARMRTAEGVLREIKIEDPESSITLSYIRGIIKSGEVPVVPIGRKRLVDVEVVMDYIASQATTIEPIPEVGKIRKISG